MHGLLGVAAVTIALAAVFEGFRVAGSAAREISYTPAERDGLDR